MTRETKSRDLLETLLLMVAPSIKDSSLSTY